MTYEHFPVLYQDVMEGLDVKPDGIYVDGTLGGASDSLGILERLGPNGRLIANDLDLAAIENAKIKLKSHLEKITFLHDDYKNLCENLTRLGIDKVDGVVLDFGVSSYQIDTTERGFSYTKEARLDMRMNEEQKLSAYDVVNGYDEEALAKVLFSFGEERYARQIARNIVKERAKQPIETTTELADVIAASYPGKDRYKSGNPAKRSFQALRVEVNNELNGLYEFLYEMALRLKVGGRMCVISFHSLEDRIVKRAFAELEKDCVCDKKMPICTCNKRKEVEILTKKPILGAKEAEINKRSESAKLRIIKRI